MFKDLMLFIAPLIIDALAFFPSGHSGEALGAVDEEVLFWAFGGAVISAIIAFIVLKNLFKKQKN